MSKEYNKEIEADSKAIAQAFVQHRKKLGLTQAKVSELSKLDQPHISKIERSDIYPAIDTMNKLAHAIGMKLILVKKE